MRPPPPGGTYANRTVPCPLCDGKTGVKDTRQNDTGWMRRRQCTECGHRFSTMEIVVPDLRNEHNRADVETFQFEQLGKHLDEVEDKKT